jgi:Rps23 Pro-64 3,4-dihydroxylase Tpa1-like proline 4-hydroxylase
MMTNASADQRDFISLHGRSIDLSALWDQNQFNGKRRIALSHAFATAAPFPHLIIDNLFSAELLESLIEDFTILSRHQWRRKTTPEESNYRSRIDSVLPHASTTYFSQLYSKPFVTAIEEITGISSLIPDPILLGGGLHESRSGDRFNIHVDFARHARTLLPNELAVITYLNKNWEDHYGGSLELWDRERRSCIKRIVPIFGRTVILKRSPSSWHGHTEPVCAPDGRPRRSITGYFYGRGADLALEAPGADPLRSRFMEEPKARWPGAASLIRQLCPPILMTAAKTAKGWVAPANSWAAPRRSRAPRAAADAARQTSGHRASAD